MGSGFKQTLKGLFSWVGTILACLLVIAIGDWLPPMHAVQGYLDAHAQFEQSVIGLMVAMAILGGLLLILPMFLVRVPGEHGASDAQAIETRGTVRGSGQVFSGRSVSIGFSDKTRLWRLKQAFRDGEWWLVPRWRRMSLMLLGGMLLFYSLPGLLFLLSPPGVKFLLFLAICYVTVRTIYAFVIDKPSGAGGEDDE